MILLQQHARLSVHQQRLFANVNYKYLGSNTTIDGVVLTVTSNGCYLNTQDKEEVIHTDVLIELLLLLIIIILTHSTGK